MDEWHISRIVIGKRHRRNVGDVSSLAESIARDGLLHPVVVAPDGRLIAGERRIRAHERLGRTAVPVRIVDLADIVRGELAENVERVPFLPSEIEAIRRTLGPEAKATAQANLKHGGRGKKVAKVSQPFRSAEKVGGFAGVSSRQVEKIAAVVEAAEAQPEKFGGLVEQMDKTGKVDAAYKQLVLTRRRESYDARREQGGTVADLWALAAAGYRAAVILADPPWSFEVYSGKGKQRSAERHYNTMTLEEITALPVASLAADDCVLFLWGVHPELPGALEVMAAWGFTYKTLGFVWVKQNPSGEGLHTGMGYWTRANTEPCWLATRGNPQRLALDVHQVIMAPVGAHSAKPAEAYVRIERLLAGPYLELFARQERPGWTVWGNEVSPPIEPDSDEEFRYVRHEDVARFTAEGWECLPALDGTHHGEYSVPMRRRER
jgi:N6-adenosine-specific RNA methylase IME4